MNRLDSLAELFRQFPGIGPRQAKRFVYFLMTRNDGYLDQLSTLISEIKRDIKTCIRCFRLFTKNGSDSSLCSICQDQNREAQSLLVVEKDVDLDTIEKSGAYRGLYFILGGSIPILEKDPEQKVRIRELLRRIEGGLEKEKLSEIILAFSVNADGENTKEYIESKLTNYKEKGLRISVLGRGLSTGSELEYVDTETIKNALQNRH